MHNITLKMLYALHKNKTVLDILTVFMPLKRVLNQITCDKINPNVNTYNAYHIILLSMMSVYHSRIYVISFYPYW